MTLCAISGWLPTSIPTLGVYWEKHGHNHIVSVGVAPVPDWRSFYTPSNLKLFLLAYVDGCKTAGPKYALAKGWAMIRHKVRMESRTPLGQIPGVQLHSAVRTA